MKSIKLSWGALDYKVKFEHYKLFGSFWENCLLILGLKVCKLLFESLLDFYWIPFLFYKLFKPSDPVWYGLLILGLSNNSSAKSFVSPNLVLITWILVLLRAHFLIIRYPSISIILNEISIKIYNWKLPLWKSYISTPFALSFASGQNFAIISNDIKTVVLNAFKTSILQYNEL